MRHLVIGAGPAGVVAAETLRRTDPAAQVTLLCGEDGAPYARMAIPYAMSGKIDDDDTRLRREAGHFRKQGIRLLHGRAAAVDAGARTVRLTDGQSLEWDRLLVATGSSPARPAIPGLDLPGVHPCWTLHDLKVVRPLIKPGRRVVVLGAGFVSCILLQSLVARGAAVTVSCGSSGRMVRSMMDETAGAMIMRWCRRKGIRVVAGGRPTAIRPGLEVALESGEVLPADVVIVGTGVRTNTGFLQGSGVQVDEGITVDQYMETSVRGIYAAGDVAQGLDRCTGRRTVHAIQPTAVEHGRIAALNMAGRPTPYVGSLAMNTLETLGLVSCSFGLWQGREGGLQVRAVDDDRFRYLRLEFFDGRLIGANTVGVTAEIGMIRGLIQGKVALGGWIDRLRSDPGRLAEAYVACTQG
jgi:NAD(P)H-nitrite reductase large subunit